MTRKPTEMELRVAKAGYEQAILNHASEMRKVLGEIPLPECLAMHAWDKQSSKLHADWIACARVMIRAMYEPTEEMKRAYWSYNRSARDGAEFPEDYQAMIDAASPPEGK